MVGQPVRETCQPPSPFARRARHLLRADPHFREAALYPLCYNPRTRQRSPVRGMSIFDQLLILVGEPPGSYVYHLVLLFALEAAAAIALSQWWARRDAARARPTGAAGGPFPLRLIPPLPPPPLAPASFLNALIAPPPLDRAASTLTLLFMIWAFAFPEPQRLADVAVTGLVLIVLLALGITWPLWAQEVGAGASFYNASIQDLAWEIAQVALMLGGGLLLVVRRKSDWLLGLGLLSLLIAGH